MNCISCGSNKKSRLGDYAFTAEHQNYHLSQCDDCGLISTDPLPSTDFLNDFYKSSFNYDWYKDHLEPKRADANQRVKEFRPYLGNSVLDYGGGFGYFSEACQQNGLDSITYDPHAPDANRTIKEMKKWDSVALFHSLEHSLDPRKTLLEVRDYLKENGTVIVAVPNSESTSYKKLGMGAVWAQPPFLHLYHFNEDSLRSLLKSVGFEVQVIRRCDRWDANYLCDVVLYKLFRRIDGGWGQIRHKGLRKVYVKISSTLRKTLLKVGSYVLNKSRQDQEIIAIARRS